MSVNDGPTVVRFACRACVDRTHTAKLDKCPAEWLAEGDVSRMGKFDDLPERRRNGLERMEEVYGFEMTDGVGDFFAYTADHLFAEIWNRPGLSDRDRRLVLIGMLAGSNQHDVLTIQVPAALAAGELDETELREIVILLAHYAGWPSGSRVNQIVEEAIAKARHRGTT